jgi:hypothetical protein
MGWSLGENGVRLFPALSFEDAGGFPTPGIRGCFHSHFECLKQAQVENRESVLIFEDDIALSSALPRLTPSIIGELANASWDFAFFGHENTGNIELAHPMTSDLKLLPYTADLQANHFYAVHHRTLPMLLDHLRRISSGTHLAEGLVPMPVDGAFNVFRRNSNVQTLIAVPKLGWQRSSRSDLSPKAIDAVPLLRPVTSVLRDLKHRIIRWRY